MLREESLHIAKFPYHI